MQAQACVRAQAAPVHFVFQHHLKYANFTTNNLAIAQTEWRAVLQGHLTQNFVALNVAILLLIFRPTAQE